MQAKEAIAEAKALLQELYAEEQVSEIRLEEVEFDESDDSWLITLGILRRSPPTSPFAPNFNQGQLKRTYKVIKIPNGGLGRPSMKIRELHLDE